MHPLNVSIRPEAASDRAAVREVNERAFEGPVEARIVDLVRGIAGAVSLVATIDGVVAGHILFTPVTIEPADTLPIPADGAEHDGAQASPRRGARMTGPPPSSGAKIAGLAPMAVRPEYQRCGIGGRLVRAGLDACRQLGYSVVVVVGHPEYYPRFGFVPAYTKGLDYDPSVPHEAFMVLELEPDALGGRTGRVRYRPEFDAA